MDRIIFFLFFQGLFFLMFNAIHAQDEPTVEAEIDSTFFYVFDSLRDVNSNKVIVDRYHNTIYKPDYKELTAWEMFRIMREDGFDVEFTEKALDSTNRELKDSNILIIHGLPNHRIKVAEDEILYQSPLSDEEVLNIGKYVANGGSLLLFVSHFPGGSGALPLLEAFGVKFRDGYAYHPRYPNESDCTDYCSHLDMNTGNGLLKKGHPIFSRKEIKPKNIKFFCGAAVFRNPEDVILAYPNNTTNYTPTNIKDYQIEEFSDEYAGMIGFSFGKGKVIVCTDQGIFRSLDLLIDGKVYPVTIHHPDGDNAALFLNSIRWLGNLD